MRRSAAFVGMLLGLACSCDVSPTTDQTDDTDQHIGEPSFDPVGRWTSTSEPERGWWDFPWQDPDTWCSSLQPGDVPFLYEDGTQADCWDGAIDQCYQSVTFNADGQLDWDVSGLVTPCEGTQSLPVGGTKLGIGTWSFMGSESGLDRLRVMADEWEVQMTSTDTFVVRSGGITYEMAIQSRE